MMHTQEFCCFKLKINEGYVQLHHNWAQYPYIVITDEMKTKLLLLYHQCRIYLDVVSEGSHQNSTWGYVNEFVG